MTLRLVEVNSVHSHLVCEDVLKESFIDQEDYKEFIRRGLAYKLVNELMREGYIVFTRSTDPNEISFKVTARAFVVNPKDMENNNG